MQNSRINRTETTLFSLLSNRLSYHQNSLVNYINRPFSKAAFLDQMTEKKANYSKETRQQLVSVLQMNYASKEISELQLKNLSNLALENTFTVTTGHQLSLFTGPIYTIYKILHVVKLAKELAETYPENNFVPIFWMASEDHDFEEVQSTSVFSNALKWESNQVGAVGRFELDQAFEEQKSQLLSLFSDDKIAIRSLIEQLDGITYGAAFFNLMHKLFDEFGVLILDGDQAALKEMFAPIMQKELLERFSEQEVLKVNARLESEQIKQQVHPREINLFYLEHQFRKRIQWVDDQFFIEDKGQIDSSILLEELKSNPERFSPNVVLRPVYQETILPNLCYVGGGGEIAYWLQLKGVFDAAGITYPLIQVRNSLQYIDPNSNKKIQALGLDLSDIFLPKHELKKKFVLNNAKEELNFVDLEMALDQFSGTLKSLVKQVDQSLEKYAEAEITKFSKQIEQIQQRLIKTEKQKFEQQLTQIDQIKERLFPNDGVQERKMNFFNLCADGNYMAHLQKIYEAIQPFENDLILYS